MHDELLEKAIQEIAANHRKIIDDWCKAYMAELYEKGIEINPGCFTLCEQVPTYHKGKDCMVKKYWFEPGIPLFGTGSPEHEIATLKEEIKDLKQQVHYLNLLRYKEHMEKHGK